MIKLSKVKEKERIFKIARENQLIIYKGILISLSVDSSAETLQARREWDDILKVLKEKKTDNQEYCTQQSCSSEMKER